MPTIILFSAITSKNFWNVPVCEAGSLCCHHHHHQRPSIFWDCLTLKIKALCSCRMHVTTCPMTLSRSRRLECSWIFFIYILSCVYMLYAFFWVIPQCLNFVCQCFGTLCLFHLHTYLHMKTEQTECSETSAYKIHTPGNYPEESIQHSEHGESLKSIIPIHLNLSVHARMHAYTQTHARTQTHAYMHTRTHMHVHTHTHTHAHMMCSNFTVFKCIAVWVSLRHTDLLGLQSC